MEAKELTLAQQDQLLSLNELGRQWRALEEESRPDDFSRVVYSPLNQSIEKTVQDFLEDKITVHEIDELNAQLEDRVETSAKERADLGDVEPLMRLRAENEVRMTITSGFPFPEFAQRLVSDAFKAASRGTLESDWIGGVFSGPNAPVEAWMRGVLSGPNAPVEALMRDAYQRTIAWLREHGPWPWPREGVEVSG